MQLLLVQEATIEPAVVDILSGLVDAKIHSAVENAIAHERRLSWITERRRTAVAVAKATEWCAHLCDPDGSENETVRAVKVELARCIRRGLLP